MSERLGMQQQISAIQPRRLHGIPVARSGVERRRRNGLRAVVRSGALLPAVALIAGCGGVPYHPVILLGPATVNDSTVAIGQLEVGIRAGPEWIEVAVRNTGDAAVEVDWGATTLLEHGGESHRLMEPRFFPVTENLTAYAWQGDTEVVQLQAVRGIAADRVHRSRASLGWSPAEPHGVVEPGGRLHKVFYPVEHVVALPHGWTVLAPLLCRRDMRDGGRFSLHLRISDGEGWQTTAIVGQLLPRPRTDAAGRPPE
jgi:hypothetical protein